MSLVVLSRKSIDFGRLTFAYLGFGLYLLLFAAVFFVDPKALIGTELD